MDLVAIHSVAFFKKLHELFQYVPSLYTWGIDRGIQMLHYLTFLRRFCWSRMNGCNFNVLTGISGSKRLSFFFFCKVYYFSFLINLYCCSIAVDPITLPRPMHPHPLLADLKMCAFISASCVP